MEPGTDPRPRIGPLLQAATALLAPMHDSARLDAEVLLAHVLDAPRHHPHAHPDRSVAADQAQHYQRLVARRLAGEPVAYLTGRREFWSLSLVVTPDTLVPRPETEHLVESALAHIPPGAAWRLADIGTGCGAVALALARERPACVVLASDSSHRALAVAQANARRLELDNVQLRVGDACAGLASAAFELIVSNPPYLAETDPHLLSAALGFEPREALVAGADGLDVIRRIARQAMRCLTPGGRLLLEHGFDQGERLRDLLGTLGYRQVATHRDYAGHERVTEARRPEPSRSGPN